MRIDCVVVSVDVADYLAASLPLNKGHFNRMVVPTAPHDNETKRVCQHYNVECFVTEAFYEGGDVFNKGRAINAALLHLAKTGGFTEWCVQMDSDIVVPPLARAILQAVPLDEQKLYGVDRLMVPSYDAWQRFLADPMPQHEQAYVHVGPFPTGTRVMKLEQGGWVPLGFFQLFHRKAACLEAPPYYPVEWDSAATSDLYFAYKWPRTHRALIPELAVFHLATEDVTNSAMGQNWMGRKTARFAPRDPYRPHGGYRPSPRPDPNESRSAPQRKG